MCDRRASCCCAGLLYRAAVLGLGLLQEALLCAEGRCRLEHMRWLLQRSYIWGGRKTVAESNCMQSARMGTVMQRIVQYAQQLLTVSDLSRSPAVQ